MCQKYYITLESIQVDNKFTYFGSQYASFSQKSFDSKYHRASFQVIVFFVKKYVIVFHSLAMRITKSESLESIMFLTKIIQLSMGYFWHYKM